MLFLFYSRTVTRISSNINLSFMNQKSMNTHIQDIPKYLCKQHEPFQQLLNQIPSSSSSSSSTTTSEMIMEIIILIYKIMIIQTYQYLWISYLKYDTGQHLKQIKLILSLKKNIDRIEERRIYLNFVNKHIHRLDCQLKSCQFQLNTKANEYPGYSFTIQHMIEVYIESNIQSFRINIEHEIELLHYDHQIRTLKLEYIQLYPNEYQIMKDICQTKYALELIEQEYQFMKYQINNDKSSSIPQSELINSIQNVNIKEHLINQYNDIALLAKNKLFQTYGKFIEEEREEYTKKYNDLMKIIWSTYHFMDIDKNKSKTMIELIDKRCQLITERLQCIYKFKKQ